MCLISPDTCLEWRQINVLYISYLCLTLFSVCQNVLTNHFVSNSQTLSHLKSVPCFRTMQCQNIFTKLFINVMIIGLWRYKWDDNLNVSVSSKCLEIFIWRLWKINLSLMMFGRQLDGATQIYNRPLAINMKQQFISKS